MLLFKDLGIRYSFSSPECGHKGLFESIGKASEPESIGFIKGRELSHGDPVGTQIKILVGPVAHSINQHGRETVFIQAGYDLDPENHGILVITCGRRPFFSYGFRGSCGFCCRIVPGVAGVVPGNFGLL